MLMFCLKKIFLMGFLLLFLNLDASSTDAGALPVADDLPKEFGSEALRQIGIGMIAFRANCLENTDVDISDCEVVRKFLRPKKAEWCMVGRSGICCASKLEAISYRLAEEIDDKGNLMEELGDVQDLCRRGMVSELELGWCLEEYGLKNKNQLKRRIVQCEKRIAHYEEIKNSIDALISASLSGVLTAEKSWNYFSQNLPDYFSEMPLGALKISFMKYIRGDYGLE